MKIKNTIGYEEMNPNNIKIKCSIIIPVYNNYNFTRACLKDLSILSYEYEVIIVDNGSSDDTINLELIDKEDLPRRFHYLRNDVNEGFARACNRGFSTAKGKYILFLNNDIRVQKNHEIWIEDLLKAAEDNSLVGPTAGLLDKNLNFVKEMNQIESGNCYISGWCMCAKKEVFNKLIIDDCQGPFSYEFGLAYFEDPDLCFRAKNINISFKIVPVPVVHFGHMTAKKMGLNKLYLTAKTIFVKKWINKI